MTVKKELMNVISGCTASDLQAWFRAGGCPLSVKARLWPESPWKAFRRLRKAR